MKKCTRCGVDKDIKEFCQNKRSGDGLYSQCRKCVADKVRPRQDGPQLVYGAESDFEG
jgi:hypothetical protein